VLLRLCKQGYDTYSNLIKLDAQAILDMLYYDEYCCEYEKALHALNNENS